MNTIVLRSLSVLRSYKFFLVIVGLLIFQAAWLALTARYPMAFDENFHFGIIQLYAQQWSPFFTSNPPNSAAYGDLIRNPSYLYQYLMSFPYRLVALFIHNEAAQIIILRFLNIGLFTAGLFVFRTLLLRLRISPAITHVSLLMLVLIPIVPFLAGQINYDNLVFLLVPIVTLLTLTCAHTVLRAGYLPARSFIALFVLCLLSCLVKYAFLPIFFALMLYLLGVIIYRKLPKTVLTGSITSFRYLTTSMKLILIASLILAGGLFLERYGVNIIQYHSLQPDCSRIESVDYCQQYGPWARNYNIKATNEAANSQVPLDPSPGLFLPSWAEGMIRRLYFAINYDYTNYYGLPIPIALAVVVGTLGIILCIIFCRTLFRMNHHLLLIALVTIVYVLSLLYVNFTDYLTFKTLLAINGRYLILILPFAFALIALACRLFINRIARKHAATYQVSLVAIVLLLTLQGGGVLTYIIRSDEGWYWPNRTVITVNTAVKNAISPLIIGAQERIRA